MFSVDKLFVSKTKPGEIRLLLKSSVGSSVSRFYIFVFSLHTALRLIGIKWLVKLCKHMLPYRSHPCINSECVCVFPSVSVPMYACLTVLHSHWCLKSLWVRDTGSRLLCTLSTFTSMRINVGVCVFLCLCVHMYLYYIMYACMCCMSLIACLYLYACAYQCLRFRVYLHTVAVLHLKGFEHQRKRWRFIVTVTTCRYNEAKESVDLQFQTCCIKWMKCIYHKGSRSGVLNLL